MSKKKHRILVVDNDKAICWVLQKTMTDEGYPVDVAMDGSKALDLMKENSYSVVILDIMMPVMDGLTALKRMKDLPDQPETIIITAHSSMDNTMEAMKLGAFDYIVKPFDIDAMITLTEKAIEKYEVKRERSKRIQTEVSRRIIGDSPSMRALYKILGRVASTDSAVLITGETGTGKDLFARAIHFHSSRRDNPFIVVNCASIPGELLESELFGHVKGAFTGAATERKGKCELADSGTIFLDEIGTMRLDLQAKILRFLQRSEFEKVGSSKTVHVDVRVIAATNEDLKKLTANGRFREDLFYRLMVVPIHVPPLRERRDDIPALAKYFVDYYNGKYRLNYSLTEEQVSHLVTRDWPGNVRELENYIHRLVVLQSSTMEFDKTVSMEVPGNPDFDSIESVISALVESGSSELIEKARERIEKPLLLKVMLRTRDNQSEAAKLLGVSRNTLRKMLAQYGMLGQGDDSL